MLHAFGHHVATFRDMLRVENRTSAHAQAQHCCTNLAKRPQHHATSTNVAWKNWSFSNLSQQHPTCRNTSQQGGQTQATCCTQQCCDMLCSIIIVVIVWTELANAGPMMSGYVVLRCCNHLAGALQTVMQECNLTYSTPFPTPSIKKQSHENVTTLAQSLLPLNLQSCENATIIAQFLPPPHLQTVIQECNHICSAPPLSPLTNSHVRMY